MKVLLVREPPLKPALWRGRNGLTVMNFTKSSTSRALVLGIGSLVLMGCDSDPPCEAGEVYVDECREWCDERHVSVVIDGICLDPDTIVPGWWGEHPEHTPPSGDGYTPPGGGGCTSNCGNVTDDVTISSVTGDYVTGVGSGCSDLGEGSTVTCPAGQTCIATIGGKAQFTSGGPFRIQYSTQSSFNDYDWSLDYQCDAQNGSVGWAYLADATWKNGAYWVSDPETAGHGVYRVVSSDDGTDSKPQAFLTGDSKPHASTSAHRGGVTLPEVIFSR